MIKRLCLAFAGLFALLSVAHAAGTVPGFSLTPQFDLTGKIAPGCKLYVIQAGTVSTPQNAYSDSGLTIQLPNPLTCDASGRLGQWFVADGNIKLRLTTSTGTQIFVGDQLLVIGASSGGGGGSPVDPTTIFSTGDMKVAYGTSVLSGFVRANGKTIGSATSGATERANSDVQALFEYLWGEDSALIVSGGRGVSAAADWAANKTIALPDWRDYAIGGLGDMGNSDAGRLTSTYWGSTGGCSGVTPITLGAGCGAESQTLTLAQLPTGITANGSNTISVTAPGGENFIVGTGIATANTNSGTNAVTNVLNPIGNASTASGSNSIAVTSNNTSGAAHPIASPMKLTTIYLKL